jgi:hypothetical protein
MAEKDPRAKYRELPAGVDSDDLVIEVDTTLAESSNLVSATTTTPPTHICASPDGYRPASAMGLSAVAV